MEFERAQITVDALVWSDDVVMKLLVRNRIDVADAESILDNDPIYIVNPPSSTRVATHSVVGRSNRNHSVVIHISETATAGVWYVHSALRSRTAHAILEREGRI